MVWMVLATLAVIAVIGIFYVLHRLLTEDMFGSDRYQDGKCRRLRGFEEVFRTVHHRGILTTCSACVVALKPGVRLPDDVIEIALTRLQQAQPMLQMQLKEMRGKYYFCSGALKIPFQRKVSKDWVKDLEEQAHGKCDNDALFTLTLVTDISNPMKAMQKTVFLFQVHHSIMDGLSLNCLMNEFVNTLNILLKQEQFKTNNPYVALFPSAEQYKIEKKFVTHFHKLLMLFILSVSKINFSLGKKIVSMLHSYSMDTDETVISEFEHIVSQCVSAVPSADIMAPKTCMIPVQFNCEQTRKLLQETRLQNTTIYGIIASASTLALEQLLNTELQLNVASLKSLSNISTVVNLRRYFPEVPDDYLGAYIEQLHQHIEIDFSSDRNKLFWRLASAASNDIHKQLKTATFLSNSWLMASLKENGLYPSGNFRLSLIAINNYGRVLSESSSTDGSSGQQLLELKGVYNVVAEHAVRMPNLFTVNCTTVDDVMCFSVLYYTNRITHSLAHKYTALFTNTILSML